MNYKSNCFYRNCKIFCYLTKRSLSRKRIYISKKKYFCGNLYNLTILREMCGKINNNFYFHVFFNTKKFVDWKIMIIFVEN